MPIGHFIIVKWFLGFDFECQQNNTSSRLALYPYLSINPMHIMILTVFSILTESLLFRIYDLVIYSYSLNRNVCVYYIYICTCIVWCVTSMFYENVNPSLLWTDKWNAHTHTHTLTAHSSHVCIYVLWEREKTVLNINTIKILDHVRKLLADDDDNTPTTEHRRWIFTRNLVGITVESSHRYERIDWIFSLIQNLRILRKCVGVSVRLTLIEIDI